MTTYLRIVLLLVISTTSCFAQDSGHIRNVTHPNANLDNIQRYKLDYELLDETLLGDSSILLQLDFSKMEEYRHNEYDMRAEDPNTKLGVLLYNRKRLLESPDKIDPNSSN